jgi:adenylosuccinate lyase
LFSDAAEIDAMVEVEIALTKVQGDLGIIPTSAVSRITKAATNFKPDFQNNADNASVS